MKKFGYIAGFPTVVAAIVLVISIVLIEYADAFIVAGRVSEGITLLMTGGLFGIGAILWWSLSIDVNTLRWELNDMRKEP